MPNSRTRDKTKEIYNNFYLNCTLSIIISTINVICFRQLAFYKKLLINLLPYPDFCIWVSSIIISSFIFSSIKINSLKNYRFSRAVFFLIIISLLLILFKNKSFEIYYAPWAHNGTGRINSILAIKTMALSLFLSGLFTIADKRLYLKNTILNITNKIAIIISGIFLIVTAYFNLINEYAQYNQNSLNLSVVLMPIINNFFGAIPPIHVPSQYGYYSIFITPILKVIGLSIRNITFIFSILFFFCFFSIFIFTKKFTKNTFLAFIVLSASFFLNTSFANTWPGGELYYQYHPIRILSPCLALLFFAIYEGNMTNARRIAMLFLLSLSVLWNADSGIPTLIAFAFASCMDIIFREKIHIAKTISYCLTETLLILSAVIFSFIWYLYIKTGILANLKQIFEPQLVWSSQRNYFIGFNQTILISTFFYSSGIIYALNEGIKGKWNKIRFSILFISLMGLGLSIYGTLHPQTAAICSYLLPIELGLFLSLMPLKKEKKYLSYKIFISGKFLYSIPISFLCSLYFFDIKNNAGYINVATYYEIIYPSKNNNRSLWEEAFIDKKDGVVKRKYIEIKDLNNDKTIIPPWTAKANFLLTKPYLNCKKGAKKIFIVSSHDYLFYSQLGCSCPLRIINFAHLDIYNHWGYVLHETLGGEFNYVVLENENITRTHNPKNYDKFLFILNKNYKKIDEFNYKFDWNYETNSWNKSKLLIYKKI